MQGNRDTQGMPERGQAAAPDQHGRNSKEPRQTSKTKSQTSGTKQEPLFNTPCARTVLASAGRSPSTMSRRRSQVLALSAHCRPSRRTRLGRS